MDKTECSWCSQEIEDNVISHKGAPYCSEECVKDWDEDNLSVEEVDLSDLDGLDDGLERDNPVIEEVGFQDDDLFIYEEDF